MQTKESQNISERTATKLAEMFTENTGKNMLDSGGASGRNWQRNAGLIAQDFLDKPSAGWERNWGISLNTFHYLNDRLEYTKTAEVLTRLMNVWEDQDPDKGNPWATGTRNPWVMEHQEDYLVAIGATQDGKVWNTYNWDNLLDQVLQGIDFELGDKSFILLQVHGGADVRGGYTRPVIFEHSCDYVLGQSDSLSLFCNECSLSGSYRGGDLSWWQYGELPPTLSGEPDREFQAPSGYDLANGCPGCGADLGAESEEVY